MWVMWLDVLCCWPITFVHRSPRISRFQPLRSVHVIWSAACCGFNSARVSGPDGFIGGGQLSGPDWILGGFAVGARKFHRVSENVGYSYGILDYDRGFINVAVPIIAVPHISVSGNKCFRQHLWTITSINGRSSEQINSNNVSKWVSVGILVTMPFRGPIHIRRSVRESVWEKFNFVRDGTISFRYCVWNSSK